MLNLVDQSWSLLATSAGDTVKLFDVSEEVDDPCTLSYTPSPGCLVNSVKWNQTNMVVASTGEDKKISLWRKNGQSMGSIPVAGTESSDNIEESISAISFSNKGSRYVCSGGTGQVVRIWDLQRKRCIKWLRGHTHTITGVTYNCKDEHLASVSVGGDLIVHNLASGARTSELKDPNGQVLRVLDYSRFSRHLLVTAGDDGTVHLWDTTGRGPKISWLKQHSAPAAGVCFSPSNEKMIASVGLDKKLYTYDSGARRPSSCISYEAPFSSLAFGDNGYLLAAGTGNGRVVFYDVRGKPQPLTALHAYSSSEAVTSLSWQTSKPVVVNEKTCTAEMALLGAAAEDSVVIPDPLPSMASSVSQSLVGQGSRSTAGLTSSMSLPSAEETPTRASLWPGGSLARLHSTRTSYNFKDDMELFSPLVDVHPMTPSLDKLWDYPDGSKKDLLAVDKKPSSSLLFPSSKRYPLGDEGNNEHPIFDWKSGSASKQGDLRSSLTSFGSTPTPSSMSEDSAKTPPEAWGGEKLTDKFNKLNGEKLPEKSSQLPSRHGFSTSFGLTSGSRDLASLNNQTNITGTRDVSMNLQTSPVFADNASSSLLLNTGMKGMMGIGNLDPSRIASLNFPRRLSTYAERISTTSSFIDGTSPPVGSPKIKKTGVETKDEFPDSLLSRSEAAAASIPGIPPLTNGGISLPSKVSQSDSQRGTNFTVQLFQRTLEETLDSFQKSIHEDMRNLHIEILRQFHMQEMEMSNVLRSVLENQAEMMKEIQSLRKENQQLRQML